MFKPKKNYKKRIFFYNKKIVFGFYKTFSKWFYSKNYWY